MGIIKKISTNIAVRRATNDFINSKNNAISMVLQNRKQFGTFEDLLVRHQLNYQDKEVHHSKVMHDYQEFYEPSNDIYSSTAQSGNNDRPTFDDLEALAFERTGFGRYFTSIFAGKSLRNGFDLYDWEGNIKKHPEILKELYKAKFTTEQIHWATYELIYGTAFLLKYWSAHDKFDQPPPKKPFLSCKAFPPTILFPENIWESGQDYLTENEELWKFRGGKYKSVSIHPDRVEILCTRPNAYDYIGYSIFEPIYLSACAYLNLIINGIKMLAKFGNVVTAFKMPIPNPSLKMYREFKDLVDEMKATYTFILGKDEEIEFLETKIGQGLYEFGEFLKEDMAAGTGLPLNQVYGRADGGGLQGAGALISKQGELETISNYQADLADNYWLMINRYWDIEDEFIKFRLDYQKSDRARYEEENLQWQNEMIKTQVQTMKLQNLLTALQAQGALPNMMPGGQDGQSGQSNVPNQTGNSVPNQSGTSIANQTGISKISKANQDFIVQNLEIIEHFQPRIIDAEFRKNNGKVKKW